MKFLPGELECVQEAFADTLTDTADIQRNRSTTFALGQPTEDWQSILPDGPVACAVSEPTSQQRQQYAAQIGAQQAWVFRFPKGQDIQGEDRILYQGKIYTVQCPIGPATVQLSTRVLATRIS